MEYLIFVFALWLCVFLLLLLADTFTPISMGFTWRERYKVYMLWPWYLIKLITCYLRGDL